MSICAQNKECLFGEIINHNMNLSDAGKIVKQIWDEISIYYNRFDIHKFVVMPNHIHGIIEIKNKHVGAGPCACPNNGQPRGLPLLLPELTR